MEVVQLICGCSIWLVYSEKLTTTLLLSNLVVHSRMNKNMQNGWNGKWNSLHCTHGVWNKTSYLHSIQIESVNHQLLMSARPVYHLSDFVFSFVPCLFKLMYKRCRMVTGMWSICFLVLLWGNREATASVTFVHVEFASLIVFSCSSHVCCYCCLQSFKQSVVWYTNLERKMIQSPMRTNS